MQHCYGISLPGATFGALMAFLQATNISSQKNQDYTLYPTSFVMERGSNLAVAGATGSGKTTLLKIIAGLVQPHSGEVRFEGKKVWGPDYTLIPGHSGIGYLSQHFELRNNYTVAEELDYANQLPTAEANAIYEICRISHLLSRRTDQLSGGEKQRIVTARLLSSAPRLLLLDEPFSNLDVEHKQVMKDMIEDIRERLQIACMLVSHDPTDTLSWADEIMVLQQGKLVQQASPQQVFHHPTDTYVAGLFGRYRLLEAQLAARLTGQQPPAGKKLLVRPGYFSWSKQAGDGVTGWVERVDFFGNHYEAVVQTETGTLSINLLKPELKTGDQVGVSLEHQDACWL